MHDLGCWLCWQRPAVYNVNSRCFEPCWECQRRPSWRARLFFAWYDLWVGFYWDRKGRVLYFCPLPCVVIAVSAPEVR